MKSGMTADEDNKQLFAVVSWLGYRLNERRELLICNHYSSSINSDYYIPNHVYRDPAQDCG